MDQIRHAMLVHFLCNCLENSEKIPHAQKHIGQHNKWIQRPGHSLKCRAQIPRAIIVHFLCVRPQDPEPKPFKLRTKPLYLQIKMTSTSHAFKIPGAGNVLEEMKFKKVPQACFSVLSSAAEIHLAQ